MRIWTLVKNMLLPIVLFNFIVLFLYMYYVDPPVNWRVLVLGMIGFSVTAYFSAKGAEKTIREKERNE